MVFKTDEDMSLDKYWEKHCISIAKDRRWAIQKGDGVQNICRSNFGD